ncbi:MAG TPA: VOC family protein [Propionibacteriaceae bacterium]|nr:VOC family protein [Propionibacteriaceae bacterium]
MLDRPDDGLHRLGAGSLQGVQLNVENVDEVHAFLRDRDVEVSEIQDYPWGRFCFFSDPDGNGWSIHGPLRPSSQATPV